MIELIQKGQPHFGRALVPYFEQLGQHFGFILAAFQHPLKHIGHPHVLICFLGVLVGDMAQIGRLSSSPSSSRRTPIIYWTECLYTHFGTLFHKNIRGTFFGTGTFVFNKSTMPWHRPPGPFPKPEKDQWERKKGRNKEEHIRDDSNKHAATLLRRAGRFICAYPIYLYVYGTLYALLFSM